MTYFNLDPWSRYSAKFESKYEDFHSIKCISKIRLSKVGHLFYSSLDVLIELYSIHRQTIPRWSFFLSLMRLLYRPSLLAVGTSVGYETWPPIGWYYRLCDWLIHTKVVCAEGLWNSLGTCYDRMLIIIPIWNQKKWCELGKLTFVLAH